MPFAEAPAHLGFGDTAAITHAGAGAADVVPARAVQSGGVLWAKGRQPAQRPTRQVSWNAKEEASLADALAALRTHLRAPWDGAESAGESDFPSPVFLSEDLTDLLAYAV